MSQRAGGYGTRMQFSAQLAEEWLEHARRAGDREAEVTVLAALAGDERAKRQVVRWEVGAREVARRRGTRAAGRPEEAD